jgi:hypothetical protein
VEKAEQRVVLGLGELVDVPLEPAVLLRVGDEAVLDEHFGPRRVDKTIAVVLRHIHGVVIRPARRMAGDLLELIRDHVRQAPVDHERGEAHRVAARGRIGGPVRMQEDRGIGPSVVRDCSGHRDGVEPRILPQQADQRVLDIRNQLDLTWRACLRLEPGLARRLVTSLNENTFHHFPP